MDAIIWLIGVGLHVVLLIYLFGWLVGFNDSYQMTNWGIGFDDGWKRGWEDGYYSGLMKGLGLTDDDRETLEERDSEKA